MDEPTKRVPFTAEPEIREILTKWKAPKVSHFSEFVQVSKTFSDHVTCNASAAHNNEA